MEAEPPALTAYTSPISGENCKKKLASPGIRFELPVSTGLHWLTNRNPHRHFPGLARNFVGGGGPLNWSVEGSRILSFWTEFRCAAWHHNAYDWQRTGEGGGFEPPNTQGI